MKVVERSGHIATYTPEGGPLFGIEGLYGTFERSAYVAPFAKPRRKERHALEVLRRLGEVRYQQWMRESGLSSGYFNRCRQRLLEQGCIERTNGGYRVREDLKKFSSTSITVPRIIRNKDGI